MKLGLMISLAEGLFPLLEQPSHLSCTYFNATGRLCRSVILASLRSNQQVCVKVLVEPDSVA